ncbi:unnamed protein product, partial [Symbiodinium necroappetens]
VRKKWLMEPMILSLPGPKERASEAGKELVIDGSGALAFDLVGILSYDVANYHHQALIQRLQEAPPPGYSKVSTAQMICADRAVFLKIAENITSLRRSGTGVLPLDSQLPTILFDLSGTYHLLPLLAGSSSSGQVKDDDKPDRPPKRPH